MILLIIILLIFFGGWGGYRYGGSDYGPHYAGGGIGLVLFIVLILWLLGVLPIYHGALR